MSAKSFCLTAEYEVVPPGDKHQFVIKFYLNYHYKTTLLSILASCYVSLSRNIIKTYYMNTIVGLLFEDLFDICCSAAKRI